MHHFDDSKIEEKSKFRFRPISYDARSETVKTIARSKAVLNDSILAANIGTDIVNEHIGFYVTKTDSRILHYPNRIWNAVTYELSASRYESTRNLYNLFDFLGELGGLFSALFTFGSIFISIF